MTISATMLIRRLDAVSHPQDECISPDQCQVRNDSKLSQAEKDLVEIEVPSERQVFAFESSSSVSEVSCLDVIPLVGLVVQANSRRCVRIKVVYEEVSPGDPINTSQHIVAVGSVDGRIGLAEDFAQLPQLLL